MLPRTLRLRSSQARGRHRKVEVHAAESTAASTSRKSAKYNELMLEKMRWDPKNPYEYNFERGLYYHPVLEGQLLCGSQPCGPEDIIYLKEAESVNVLLSLQQEKDPAYWGIDSSAIHAEMEKQGVAFIRCEAVDFDKDSLRATLPRAVGHIARSIRDGKTVYVHCTAGLGRAPASCIAYLYWFRDYNLDTAYEYLTSVRPCGPNRDAIRAATFDACSNRPACEFAALPSHAFHDMSASERCTLQERVMEWR